MNKTEYRAFNIAMPEPIIPIYDFLQKELNTILNNEIYRQQLQALDLTKHKGNIWRDMRDMLKPRLKEWTINNKTWHSYILYENLRRELQSKEENIKIWEEYKLNENKVNKTLYENLINKYKIYATRGRIENIVSKGTVPELAREATFQLDYTISEKQMFRINEHNPYLFEIKVGNTAKDWIGYLVETPNSINSNFTGKITKPRFMKRKSDGKYIGICSYEVEIKDNKTTKAIMGVDIGKINPYSAIVLEENKIISPQLLPSKKLYNLNKKLNLLQKEREALYQKNKRYEKYKVESEKHNNRLQHYKNIRHKISNLTTYMASQIAYELTELAKEYKCKEIHIENLSWLKSTGKKWNHSEIFQKIEEVATLDGIKVVKVDAHNSSKEHPITKEVGEVQNRKIQFVNGKYIDRDLLASINLALRNKKKKETNKIKEIKILQKKRKRLSKSRKKEILDTIKKKSGVQIVAFRPSKVREFYPTTWQNNNVRAVYTSCLTRNKTVANRYNSIYL